MTGIKTELQAGELSIAADHAILADINRRHRQSALRMSAALPSSAEFFSGKDAALISIADCFAREANVEVTLFLEACGLT